MNTKMKIISCALGFTALAVPLIMQAVDTAVPQGDKLLITSSADNCKKKGVFYVNLPSTVVSPPNNLAYSHAAITEDFIYLSGVTGQLLDGEPAPLGPDGITQITQAYQNLTNIIDYLGFSVDDVVKLDVLIEAQDASTFQTYRSTANTVQSNIWEVQPPRTITGVNTLNLGVLEVTAILKNTKKLKIQCVD